MHQAYYFLNDKWTWILGVLKSNYILFPFKYKVIHFFFQILGFEKIFPELFGIHCNFYVIGDAS